MHVEGQNKQETENRGTGLGDLTVSNHTTPTGKNH